MYQDSSLSGRLLNLIHSKLSSKGCSLFSLNLYNSSSRLLLQQAVFRSLLLSMTSFDNALFILDL